MRLPGILRKLNRTYSIVIIPNSNDSVKRISVKAPFIKFFAVLALISAITIPLFCNLSADATEQAKANESLEKQVQALSRTILEQNDTLKLSNDQFQSLQTSDATIKSQIQDFARMFADITEDYATKSSRGTSAKSTSNAIQDIIKLSSLVDNLNKNLNKDDTLSKELQKSKETLNKFVDSIPTFVPAKGTITSPFGRRRHPILRIRLNHNGVDIDSPKGAPIMAAASGEVIYSGYSSGFGYHVIIDHKNGYETTYAHCSKLIAKVGDLVDKGQKIALVGSTGLSTGPHLHFELKINGTVVDPTQYINFN
jgi:murein DD-endopeptidase MepM/ murein hydrolase activator NlpD